MHPALRLFAAAAAFACAAAQAVVALPAYNVDRAQTTVSGLSSGAFMASQLGWAHSSLFRGVGLFAGGPYPCAALSNYTACMYNATISSTQLAGMQNSINTYSGNGGIDPKAGVAAQQVFMFVGTSDTTVGPNPMNAVQAQYGNNGVPAANLQYVQRAATAHVFPTDFDATGNNACSSTASPYISNCGYDGAKAVLSRFYGTLNPRNDAPAAGNYIEFDQRAFTTNPGMAASGWVYVPANCAGGAQCRVHVALHGCQQSYGQIGDKFIRNTGYTRWADTNSIIVLFPQTQVDNTVRQTAASGLLSNPNACWDWTGWYGSNFAQKSGAQVSALKAMVDRLSSGAGSGGGGGTALPAPTGVTVSGATSTSMAIAWAGVTGAASYNVFRNGTKVNALGVTATSYTDTGLSSGTTYAWTVAGVDANGAQGALSAPVSGTTTGAVATCYTASNYNHTAAGRAHMLGGITYANGSNQNMGLWNTFVVTTLKQTGTNYYVIGTCS
ncbi:extracellular catalytic domain type 2 short-chain-length polyhydroxyalkanoate depolymerase [Ramlibacter sp. AN1133]|uniref:extracellular catalytic domain type 2 short-chain-length polyhydroxyalkanoate depolymerase n=1 Tax=Ramlibacter sp. AN1133 TaxID=3133429 RepID=UPI0030BD0EBA